MERMMDNKWVRRVVCTVTIVFFSFTQVVSAVPGMGVEIAVQGETPGFIHLSIPADLASLDDIYEAPPSPSPRLILHVQNAHANYDAQTKIKNLLEYLSAQYAVRTIFVEGASGTLDPDYLKFFPDQARNRELADRLARQGELTGAELFILEADRQNIRAEGIESTDLYRKNYEALKKVYENETVVLQFIEGLESRLRTLASQVAGRDLLRMISEWKRFERGQREFMPYVRSLAEDARQFLRLDLESLFSQVEWPQLTRLLTIQDMEKELQPSRAVLEQEKLLALLRRSEASPELIDGIANFRDQHISLARTGSRGSPQTLQPRYLLERLVNEMGPQGFKFSDYPAFSLQAGYLILKSELDSRALFDEIHRLFQMILDKMAVTEAQKKLLALYRDEELVRKLLRLELTRRDWRELQSRRDELAPDPLMERLKSLAEDARVNLKLGSTGWDSKKGSPKLRSRILELYGAADLFYDYARARESAFFEKISEVMIAGRETSSVLITGGFHTDGMSDIFRENQISYGILTPRLSEKSDESLYRNSMLQRGPGIFDTSTIELFSKMLPPDVLKSMGANPDRVFGQNLGLSLELTAETSDTMDDIEAQLQYLQTFLPRFDLSLNYEVDDDGFRVLLLKNGAPLKNDRGEVFLVSIEKNPALAGKFRISRGKKNWVPADKLGQEILRSSVTDHRTGLTFQTGTLDPLSQPADLGRSEVRGKWQAFCSWAGERRRIFLVGGMTVVMWVGMFVAHQSIVYARNSAEPMYSSKNFTFEVMSREEAERNKCLIVTNANMFRADTGGPAGLLLRDGVVVNPFNPNTRGSAQARVVVLFHPLYLSRIVTTEEYAANREFYEKPGNGWCGFQIGPMADLGRSPERDEAIKKWFEGNPGRRVIVGFDKEGNLHVKEFGSDVFGMGNMSWEKFHSRVLRWFEKYGIVEAFFPDGGNTGSNTGYKQLGLKKSYYVIIARPRSEVRMRPDVSLDVSPAIGIPTQKKPAIPTLPAVGPGPVEGRPSGLVDVDGIQKALDGAVGAEKVTVEKDGTDGIAITTPGKGVVVVRGFVELSVQGKQIRITHRVSSTKKTRSDLLPIELPFKIDRPMEVDAFLAMRSVEQMINTVTPEIRETLEKISFRLLRNLGIELDQTSPALTVTVALTWGIVNMEKEPESAFLLLREIARLVDTRTLTGLRQRLSEQLPGEAIPFSGEAGNVVKMIDASVLSTRESTREVLEQLMFTYLFNPEVRLNILALGDEIREPQRENGIWLAETFNRWAATWTGVERVARPVAVGVFNRSKAAREAQGFLNHVKAQGRYVVAGDESLLMGGLPDGLLSNMQALAPVLFESGVNTPELQPMAFLAAARASQRIGTAKGESVSVLVDMLRDPLPDDGYQYENGRFVINSHTLSAIKNLQTLFAAFQKLQASA